MGAGLGELEDDDATALSVGIGMPRREDGTPAPMDVRFRACVNAVRADVRFTLRGDDGGGISPGCEIGATGTGEAESDGALKG
jgi:hypothetical protein